VSGYFDRLLERGRGGGAGIRPLWRRAYAATFMPTDATFADGGEIVAGQGLPDRPADVGAVVNQPLAAFAAGAAHAAVANAEPVLRPAVESSRIAAGDGEPGSIGSHLSQPGFAMALPHSGDEWGGDTGVQGAARAAVASPSVTAGHDEFRLLPPVLAPVLNATRSAVVSPSPARDPARVTDPSRGGRRDPPAASEATEIHVSIGRIEVTAVSAPAPPKHTPAAGPKAMSLDDYLRKRQRERT